MRQTSSGGRYAKSEPGSDSFDVCDRQLVPTQPSCPPPPWLMMHHQVPNPKLEDSDSDSGDNGSKWSEGELEQEARPTQPQPSLFHRKYVLVACDSEQTAGLGPGSAPSSSSQVVETPGIGPGSASSSSSQFVETPGLGPGSASFSSQDVGNRNQKIVEYVQPKQPKAHPCKHGGLPLPPFQAICRPRPLLPVKLPVPVTPVPVPVPVPVEPWQPWSDPWQVPVPVPAPVRPVSVVPPRARFMVLARPQSVLSAGVKALTSKASASASTLAAPVPVPVADPGPEPEMFVEVEVEEEDIEVEVEVEAAVNDEAEWGELYTEML